MRLSLWLLLAGCAGPSDDAGDRRLRVRWIRSDPEREAWVDVERAVVWTLSVLGASPDDPALISDVITDGDDSAVFTLDLDRAGFDARPLEVLDVVLHRLRGTSELDARGHVDLGRFVAATVYDPWAYYAFTGACATREAWQARHDTGGARIVVTDSLVALGDRDIAFEPEPASLDAIAFLAHEGEGSVAEGTFVGREHEALDVLGNGQARYAIYDDEGALAPTADPSLTRGGTPGKCLWCHEGLITPMFTENPAVGDAWSSDEFNQAFEVIVAAVAAHRDERGLLVDWRADTHTKAELLAEHFVNSPYPRIAVEWDVPVAQVEEVLGSEAIEGEYPALGPVVPRAVVDEAAGIDVLSVVGSTREHVEPTEGTAFAAYWDCRD